ncbi:MAG: hypothetical protein LBK82_12070 [Planctomycetaceae bacterium]|nr:hypothetical protein [Planctomycetaceae bacterium]
MKSASARSTIDTIRYFAGILNGQPSERLCSKNRTSAAVNDSRFRFPRII